MGTMKRSSRASGRSPPLRSHRRSRFESLRKGASTDLRRARDSGEILPQPEARQHCQSRIELMPADIPLGSGGELLSIFLVLEMADNCRRAAAAIEAHYRFLYVAHTMVEKFPRSHKFSSFLKMLFAAMHESAMAQPCRLGRCRKSAAIWGTPVAMPTKARWQPVILSEIQLAKDVSLGWNCNRIVRRHWAAN